MFFAHDRKKHIAFLFVSCFLEGFFPVIAHYGSAVLPPLFFLALSTLVASLIYFLYILHKNHFPFTLTAEQWKDIFGLVVFVMLPYQLIFLGTRLSSGINTALFLQAEILFAYLWSILLFKERPRLQKLAGATAILSGMLLVLFDGSVTFSKGGLLILLATAMFPIGNMFAKSALQKLPASVVLFLRTLIGGTIVLIVSFLVEDPLRDISGYADHLWLVPLYAVLILFFSKMFWYKGLRGISLSTATSILSLAPAFGVLFVFLFLGEIPTGYQIAGFLSAISGVYIVLSSHKAATLATPAV